jgi:hypothetical protein
MSRLQDRIAQKNLIYIAIIVLSSLSSSGQAKDTIFMLNEQVLIGEIKMVSLGKVEIDADDIGVVDIKGYKIRTMKAATHYYRIETIQRQVYFSRIEPADERGKIRIRSNDSTLLLSIEDISNLRPLKSLKAALWEGDVSAGYSYTRSSKIGRLNGAVTIKYITRKIELDGQYSIIVTQSDTGWVRDNESGGITAYYYINSNWQALGFLNYQRNLQLGLARRFQEGFGMSYNLISSPHVRFKTGTGIVFNQELNTEGEQKPTQVEIPIVNTFNFFSFRKPDMNLQSTQNLYFSLSQKGRIRHDGQIKLTWKLITDLSINITLYDNYDSQPPGTDASDLDYGVVFGLTYSFSR